MRTFRQRSTCASTGIKLSQTRRSDPVNGRGRSCTVAAKLMEAPLRARWLARSDSSPAHAAGALQAGLSGFRVPSATIERVSTRVKSRAFQALLSRVRFPLSAPLFLAAALTGCAPHIRYISTACITQAQLDQLRAQEPPKVRALLNGQADHDLKIIAANDVRFRAYADGLLTVLGGCVEKN